MCGSGTVEDLSFTSSALPPRILYPLNYTWKLPPREPNHCFSTQDMGSEYLHHWLFLGSTEPVGDVADDDRFRLRERPERFARGGRRRPRVRTPTPKSSAHGCHARGS